MQKQKKKVLWKLAHMGIEAKESHRLPCAGWRTWKSGVTRSESEGLRRGADGGSLGFCLNARESGAPMNKGRRRGMSQLRQRANSPSQRVYSF